MSYSKKFFELKPDLFIFCEFKADVVEEYAFLDLMKIKYMLKPNMENECGVTLLEFARGKSTKLFKYILQLK